MCCRIITWTKLHVVLCLMKKSGTFSIYVEFEMIFRISLKQNESFLWEWIKSKLRPSFFAINGNNNNGFFIRSSSTVLFYSLLDDAPLLWLLNYNTQEKKSKWLFSRPERHQVNSFNLEVRAGKMGFMSCVLFVALLSCPFRLLADPHGWRRILFIAHISVAFDVGCVWCVMSYTY